MPLKFEDLKHHSENHTIYSVEEKTIDYPGFNFKVKLVTMTSGLKGMVALNRFAEFKSAVLENENGDAELPVSWRVGKKRWGLPYGYWFNTDKFVAELIYT